MYLAICVAEQIPIKIPPAPSTLRWGRRPERRHAVSGRPGGLSAEAWAL